MKEIALIKKFVDLGVYVKAIGAIKPAQILFVSNKVNLLIQAIGDKASLKVLLPFQKYITEKVQYTMAPSCYHKKSATNTPMTNKTGKPTRGHVF